MFKVLPSFKVWALSDLLESLFTFHTQHEVMAIKAPYDSFSAIIERDYFQDLGCSSIEKENW